MATTTSTVGDTVTRTTRTNTYNSNRAIYWSLAALAIIIIAAILLTAHRNRTTATPDVPAATATVPVTPNDGINAPGSATSTATDLNGAAPVDRGTSSTLNPDNDTTGTNHQPAPTDPNQQ
jgi:hypothetical protein